jgi:hypothetical protein
VADGNSGNFHRALSEPLAERLDRFGRRFTLSGTLNKYYGFIARTLEDFCTPESPPSFSGFAAVKRVEGK